MPQQYFVIIKNHSGDVQNYLLFNEAPEPGPLGTPYSNVWLHSKGVFSPNGQGKFSIGVEHFAVCGTTIRQQTFGLNVQVDTSDFAPVTLSEDKEPGTMVLMEIKDEGAGFVPPPGTITQPGGSFEIKTGAFSSREYPYVWCGLGKYDDKGNVVPVVSWQAKSSLDNICTPITNFWVSTGTFAPGTVVDRTSFGAIVPITFSDQGNIATIEHHIDGTYSDPVYTFSQPKSLRELQAQENAA